jgi:hypothetical protein
MATGVPGFFDMLHARIAETLATHFRDWSRWWEFKFGANWALQFSSHSARARGDSGRIGFEFAPIAAIVVTASPGHLRGPPAAKSRTARGDFAPQTKIAACGPRRHFLRPPRRVPEGAPQSNPRSLFQGVQLRGCNNFSERDADQHRTISTRNRKTAKPQKPQTPSEGLNQQSNSKKEVTHIVTVFFLCNLLRVRLRMATDGRCA